MTYNIDVDPVVFALKNAEIRPGKFAAPWEADSEPAIFLTDAIFHLEEHVLLGPVHHPRESNFVHGIERDGVHLRRRNICMGESGKPESENLSS